MNSPATSWPSTAIALIEADEQRRGGPSTGTNVIGTLTPASDRRARGEPGAILSLPCDAGERNLPSGHDAAGVQQNIGDCAPAHQRLQTLLA